MNIVVVPKAFTGYLRKKRKGPKYLFDAAQSNLLKLRHDPNPESLGERKEANLRHCLALQLNDSNRILYSVVRTEGQVRVILLRVCDHKVAYPRELSQYETWLIAPTTTLGSLPVSL
jgi:hypothetical protein